MVPAMPRLLMTIATIRIIQLTILMTIPAARAITVRLPPHSLPGEGLGGEEAEVGVKALIEVGAMIGV